jgi:hypothetical protein
MPKSQSEDATDRAGRPFATLTAQLEDAHELTVAGQNPATSVPERKNLLRRLERRLARCHATVTEIAALLGRERGRQRPSRETCLLITDPTGLVPHRKHCCSSTRPQ